jgi:hypothetical protein
MVNVNDYGPDEVIAAHSVLLELVHLLGEYRHAIVVVGGWVPDLHFSKNIPPHIGSIDVDLALDHRTINEAGYRTIMELLLAHNYQVDDHQPFIFFRDIIVNDRRFRVEVDFLAGEYGGTSPRHRTQIIQDIRARKARGCDLAFENPVTINLQGRLPDGALDTVAVKVAAIAPFLVMKAEALSDRLKEKDAYDIYYCLTNYPGGTDGLVEAFQPFIGGGLLDEGLKKLASAFASPDHFGPKYIANFLGIIDPEERARIQRDAYERVVALLDHPQLKF